MQYLDFLFYGLVFLTAFLYSSVGHGGASGYLALMSIFAFSPDTMKATALTMNLFVSGIAFFINFRMGYFKPKILFPFVTTSIPFAFVGARIQLNPTLYKIMLGAFLVIISIRFMFFSSQKFDDVKKANTLVLLIIGAILGFLSGMLGIGGGVILSPILLFFHWSKMRQASAIAAAFIFLNSMAGLAGLISKGYSADKHLWLMVLIGVAGALIGSYSSVKKFNTKTIQYILTIVLLSAGIKLMIF